MLNIKTTGFCEIKFLYNKFAFDENGKNRAKKSVVGYSLIILVVLHNI